jgi:hypothetical protein
VYAEREQKRLASVIGSALEVKRELSILSQIFEKRVASKYKTPSSHGICIIGRSTGRLALLHNGHFFYSSTQKLDLLKKWVRLCYV